MKDATGAIKTTTGAIASYQAMIASFNADQSAIGVEALIAQIRAGFCSGAYITLNMFALLCADEDGHEHLLEHDEEGWNFWIGWRGSYERSLEYQLVPLWQEMLTATNIYQAHAGDIVRVEGDQFTIRLHGVAIGLTTMEVHHLLDSSPGKRLAGWQVFEIVDDSDDSVVYQEADIPLTTYAAGAMVKATALMVEHALGRYCGSRVEEDEL